MSDILYSSEKLSRTLLCRLSLISYPESLAYAMGTDTPFPYRSYHLSFALLSTDGFLKRHGNDGALWLDSFFVFEIQYMNTRYFSRECTKFLVNNTLTNSTEYDT